MTQNKEEIKAGNENFVPVDCKRYFLADLAVTGVAFLMAAIILVKESSYDLIAHINLLFPAVIFALVVILVRSRKMLLILAFIIMAITLMIPALSFSKLILTSPILSETQSDFFGQGAIAINFVTAVQTISAVVTGSVFLLTLPLFKKSK